MRGARAADIAATMTRKRESKGLESLAREGMTEQVPPPEVRILLATSPFFSGGADVYGGSCGSWKPRWRSSVSVQSGRDAE